MDCLYKDEEIRDGNPPEGTIIVDGIVSRIGFHPERLKAKESEVISMLEQLSDEFKKSGGGGMSFLNMCELKTGFQWTGLHQRMEQLMMMAIGLGKGEYCMPRDYWKVLPGSMPYVVFDV